MVLHEHVQRCVDDCNLLLEMNTLVSNQNRGRNDNAGEGTPVLPCAIQQFVETHADKLHNDIQDIMAQSLITGQVHIPTIMAQVEECMMGTLLYMYEIGVEMQRHGYHDSLNLEGMN